VKSQKNYSDSFGNDDQMTQLEEMFIVHVQAVVLKLTGFLRYYENTPFMALSGRQKVVSAIFSCVAIVLLLGTFFYGCLESSISLYGLIYPASVRLNEGKSGLLRFMEKLPYTVICIRSFMVLIFFFFKRNHWKSLNLETNRLLKFCFPNKLVRKLYLSKLKWISGGLLSFSCVVHLLWQYFAWKNYFAGFNITWFSDESIAPLPVKMYTWQFVIINSLFSTLPFMLSQQVYLCVVISVIVLYSVSQALAEELQQEILFYQLLKGRGAIFEGAVGRTEIKLHRWKCIHFDLVRLTEIINDFFGMIFLMTYGLDTLTMLGFTSWVISTSGRQNPARYTYSIGSVVLFGAYVTMLPSAMIVLLEKVK
jgi:hypothetical protein